MVSIPDLCTLTYLDLSCAKDFRKLNYMVTWCIDLRRLLALIFFTVDNFAFLFNCTPVGRTSDSMTVPI